MQQPEVTELTNEEREIYLKLQAKVGWRRTGTEVFESFFPILPMVPSELAVVREINSVSCVLMWRRKDAHYEGWHMPGGYLLCGESDRQWIERVLKKEANLELKNFHFIRRFNTRPETGWVPNHQMAHFFLCLVEGEPSVGEFFPLTEIPDDTLGHHKKYIEYLRAHFLRMETMCKPGIRHDYFDKAQEGKWLLVNRDDTLSDLSRHSWGIWHYPDLDSAVSRFNALKDSGCEVYLLDDQGLQIL